MIAVSLFGVRHCGYYRKHVLNVKSLLGYSQEEIEMNRVICYYLYDNKSGTETVRRGVKWILETAKPRGGLIAVQERGNLQDYGREEGLSLVSLLDKAPHRVYSRRNTF